MLLNVHQARLVERCSRPALLPIGFLLVFFLMSFSHAQQRWTRTYGGTNDDRGFGVQQTSDGGYIVSGCTQSYGAGDWDCYLIKTNASGDTLWTRTYGGVTDERGGAQPTSDGGYIISGACLPVHDDTGDIYLVKTNGQGDVLWTKRYDGANDIGYAGCQTTDGGYIVSGGTEFLESGDTLGDVWLIKTNASGDTLWTRTYGGTNADVGYTVQQTLDGGYIISGTTTSFGAGMEDIYLIKTDANGNAGVAEKSGQGPAVKGQGYQVTPNPFASSASIPGHETERFGLYDVSGTRVGACRGDRFGERLSPGVYFIRPEAAQGRSVRIVKVR